MLKAVKSKMQAVSETDIRIGRDRPESEGVAIDFSPTLLEAA